MSDFPTLGLRFDLTEVLGGEAALKRVRDLYVEIANAKAAAQAPAGSTATSAADTAAINALQARIARYEELAALMAQAENGGVSAAKNAAAEILASDAALATKRVEAATKAGAQIANAEAMTAQQILRARQGLAAGLAQAAGAEVRMEEQTAAQILALRMRMAAQQAKATAGTGTSVGIAGAQNDATLQFQQRMAAQQAAEAARAAAMTRAEAELDDALFNQHQKALALRQLADAQALNREIDLEGVRAAALLRAEADFENARFDSLTKALALREVAEAQAMNARIDADAVMQARLLRQEADADNARVDALVKALALRDAADAAAEDRMRERHLATNAAMMRSDAEAEDAFIQRLRIRAAANVPVSDNQVSLMRVQAMANGYGPDAGAAIAEIEAMNRALADASKAAAGAEFIKELEQLSSFGVKLGPASAAMKALKAEQLGVAAQAAPLIAGMEKTAAAMGHVGGSAFRVRESLVLMREAMRGDFTRMAGSATLLGQSFGLLNLLMNPLVLLFIALTAATAGFLFLVDQGAAKLAHFNNQMKATAGAAGITFDAMVNGSKALAESTDNAVGSIEKTMMAVVASGKVSGQAVQDTTEAATRLADLTAGKATEVANSLVGMYGNAADGAAKLNDQVHFLTLKQYEEIDALQKAGDSTGAYALAVHDLAEHLRNEGTPEMGFFEERFHSLHTWIDKVIQKIQEFGRAAPAAVKVNSDMATIVALQQRGQTNTPMYQAAVQKLQMDQDAAAAEESKAAAKAYADRTQANGIQGYRDARATDRSIGSRSANEEYIQELQDSYQANVINGLRANPNDKLLLEDQAHMAERLAAIRAKHSPRVRGVHTDGIRNHLGAQQGDIDALLRELESLSENPISLINGEIDRAGSKAAGGTQFGARSAFQSQAASLAEQQKRLELIKALNVELVKQTANENEQVKSEKLLAAAQAQAFAAQSAYYQKGATTAAGDIRLEQQLIDIQAQGVRRQNEYNIARRFGVDSIDQIAGALAHVTGITQTEIDATVRNAQADLVAANAVTTRAAATQRAAVVMQKLVDADHQRAEQLKRLKDLQTAGGLATADEREAQARVTEEAVFKRIIVAMTHGVSLTQTEAENIERANQLLLVQQEYWANLAIQMKDAFEQTFEQTGKLDFKGLRQGAEEALRKAIYDSLIAKPINIVVNATVSLLNQIENQLLQPLGDRLLASLGGGGSAASLFGGAMNFDPTHALSGLTNTGSDSLIGNLSSLDTTIHDLPKALSAGGGAGGGLFSLLGTAGAGAIGGSAVASLFGAGNGSKASSYGAMAGGAAGLMGGAALGSSIAALGAWGGGSMLLTTLGAAAGPIGMAIGAVLGAVLAGALGGKPSNFAAIDTITPSGYSTVAGTKANSDTQKMADAFAQAVVNSEGVLKAAGITTKSYVSGIDIGSRDKPMVTFSDGRRERLGNVGDPASAAEAAMKELLQGATYASDAEKQLTESMLAAGASFDDIAKKLQEFGQAQDFLKGIDRSILKAQDPLGAALADLQDQQIARRKQAITYYQDGVLSADQLTALQAKLKTLEKLEIDQTLSQFNTGLTTVTATLSDFQAAQTKIISYAQGLLVGQLSPLSPQDQLNTAASAFQTMLTKAQGGDKDSLDNITGAADTYLNQAHSFYASSSGYASIFNTVQAALQALGAQAYPGDATGTTTTPDHTEAGALAELQAAITTNNADLITALSPAANDTATGADIASQTTTLVTSLQGVQQTIAASTEAITLALGSGQTVRVPLNLSDLLAGGAVAA